MEISPTPQILMQNLLDGTKKVIVELINLEIPNLNLIEKKRLAETMALPARYSFVSGINQDDCELLKVLKYLWKDWDLLKDKIFVSNEENSFGRTTRSYISILMQARNDWAHDTLTYEDVLHYGFVVQRLKRSIQDNSDGSFADQIIEFCIEKISEKDIKKVEESSVLTNDMDEGFKKNDKNLDQRELEVAEEVTSFEETGGGEKVISEEELEENDKEIFVSESAESNIENVTEASEEDKEEVIEEEPEETEEINYIFEFEEIRQYSGEELTEFLNLCQIIEKKEYGKLSDLLAHPRGITVQPGTFTDTLFFSDGFISFAFGVRKIELIIEYIRDISAFAVFDKIKPSMAALYQNCAVICIPSIDKTKIMFGRNKARMISSSWKNIEEWLEGYR